MERPARVTPLMAWLVAGALAATTAPLGAQVALDVLELPGGVLSDDFGSGMALDGDTLLIGVPRGNSLQPGPGFVLVYRRDDRGTPSDPTDDTWTEAGPRIEASAGLAGEKFGYSAVTLVNGLSLPLVPDLYMTATLQGPNTNGLESTLGVLDAAGKATARIVFPEGADPFLAGLALHHAYVLFTPTLDFVSNAVPLQLVPAYTLLGDVAAISVATGGTQEFELRAGASAAGSVYLVLGSVTGTTPGFALDGFTVPLNLDFYTQLSFGEANGPLFENTYGVLDSLGTGAARLVLPAGLTAAAGLELHHAFVVFDAVTGTANFASNPLALTLIP